MKCTCRSQEHPPIGRQWRRSTLRCFSSSCQTTTLAEPEPLERSAHRERAVKETETELAGERGRFPVSRALLYRPRQAYRPSQGVAILVALGSGPWAWLGTTSRAEGGHAANWDRQMAGRKKEAHVRNKTRPGWATKKGLTPLMITCRLRCRPTSTWVGMGVDKKKNRR